MSRFVLIILFLFIPYIAISQNIEDRFFRDDEFMTSTFNRLVDSISTDVSKSERDDLKFSFQSLINDDRLSSEHRQMICDVLNYYVVQSVSISIYTSYVDAFSSFITSDFDIKDCKHWTDALTTSQVEKEKIIRWNKIFSDKILFSNTLSKWEIKGGKCFIYTVNDEPVIEIKEVKLQCPLYDSIIINDCSGRLYFNTGKLCGTGGTVTWEKAGLKSNDVYAKLPKRYEISLGSTHIVIDSVSFYYKTYFKSEPILGTFSDKCVQKNSVEMYFPKFIPYNNLACIKNIYPGVDFTGCFMLEGSKISGSGSDQEEAHVTIKRDNSPYFILKSQLFSFSQTKLVSRWNDLTIIIKGDTITHPACKVRYDTEKCLLEIIRDPDETGAAPFFSSFHNINIYSDKLNWVDSTEFFTFSPEAAFDKEGSAFFESANFFSEERFRQFETPDGVNMLISLLKYSKEHFDLFYLDEFAKYCKIADYQVKSLLLNIADYGLISYNLKTDQISINKKLYEYISSKSKKRDYDIISIYSFVKDHDNAQLDLRTMNLKIYGVDQLILSEKGKVKIVPTSKVVDVAHNMDIHFKGYIQAGLVDIYSRDGYFKYNSFKIELPEVDSISFYFFTGKYDLAGHQIIDKIYSPIENLQGYLEINKYYNKSGIIEDCKDYPRFWSTDSAFVYYQKDNVCHDVYKRDNFYFLIDPFMVDSLATYIPNQISFSGEFISDSIFPTFRENLVIMPGQSLGFKHDIPDGGYYVYDGKGKMNGKISLSNECLQVNGVLDYLTAELKSDNFMMYPDSMNAIVDEVVIEETYHTAIYPYVRGNKSNMHLDVGNNAMTFNTISGDPYYLYHDLFSLQGELQYSEKNIIGRGLLRSGQGVIESEKYVFNTHNFLSDSVVFRYYLPDNKYTVADATNFSLDMDIDKKRGYFSAIGYKNSSILFKENGYSSNYRRFEWDIEGKKMQLGEVGFVVAQARLSEIGDLTGDSSHYLGSEAEVYAANIVATNKKSDSLNFNSVKGEYDYQKSTLKFEGIDKIVVSDAAIIPKDRSVTATVGGALMPINDGFIIINLASRYHTLYNINTTIKSKKEFSGSGYYDYVDAVGNSTAIYVESIGTIKDSTIRGRAIISELSPLHLNPVVDFQGTIKMTNKESQLDFDGYYHVKQPCFEDNTWIKLANGADPKEIRLPINGNYLSIKNQPIVSGLVLSKPGAVLYPTFLSTKKKTTDWSIFNIEGVLSFSDNKYSISDTSHNIGGLLEKGLSFNPENCSMRGAGEYNIYEREGRIDLATAGEFEYNFTNDSITLTSAIFLDFHFNEAAIDVCAKELTTSQVEMTTDNSLINSALHFIIPEREFEDYYEELSRYGSSSQVPEVLKSNIVLTDVRLVWDDKSKVFHSVGQITVSSIKGVPINRKIDGVVEISKLGGTESITIMIITNGEYGISNKYFFFYHNNNMFAFSTNEEFSNLIRNDSKKVRRKKREGTLPAYQYIIATSERLGEFCNKYGIK